MNLRELQRLLKTGEQLTFQCGSIRLVRWGSVVAVGWQAIERILEERKENVKNVQ